MVNETVGWILVLGSLVLGLYMGLKFQREDWLGGYNGFPRRMVRLAHIALAALGVLNILFAQTAPRLHLEAPLVNAASTRPRTNQSPQAASRRASSTRQVSPSCLSLLAYRQRWMST